MNRSPEDRVERLKRANPKRKPDEDPEGRIPPGQYLTDKFPVLTHGETQHVDPASWRFRVWGEVEERLEWTFEAFGALPKVERTTDFHCVTRWSQLDNVWTGVHINEIMSRIKVLPEAQFVMVHAVGGYTTNLPLADLVDDDVLFAYTHNGEPLSAEHGGPIRLVVPKLYAWKSAKWVNGLEFMARDRPGFWEDVGYHDRGDPWKEQRFS